MISTSMEDTKTEIKSKISFSVESLLSKDKSTGPSDAQVDIDIDDSRLDVSSEHLDEDDDENINVDDEEDTDGRESLSPNSSSHTVVVPQPLHPSVPRLLAGPHHQWPFAWVGPGGLIRPSSPSQGK